MYIMYIMDKKSYIRLVFRSAGPFTADLPQAPWLRNTNTKTTASRIVLNVGYRDQDFQKGNHSGYLLWRPWVSQ